MVGPIWDNVCIGEGRDTCQIFSGNDLASRPELGEDLGHAHSIPHQHRVGEQAQTAHFVHNLLVVNRAKHPLIRKEEPTREPQEREGPHDPSSPTLPYIRITYTAIR